ncbi:small integral membrane protein 5 [Eucyclogobius newberryi]|uniref:small integral membrane protein 5 n=1 Tax=Eucyclogobius newberryi TaxID=166745 RepID=UPI003B5BA7F7
MNPQQHMRDIVHRIWSKLQALPQAGALEIGAFAVLLLFVAAFLFLVVISCTSCCSAKAQKPPKSPQRPDPRSAASLTPGAQPA